MRGRLGPVIMNGNNARVTLFIEDADYLRDAFDELSNVDLDITIKKVSKKRSKNANSYCWELCTLIANKLNDGTTKEDVYREAIKRRGVCRFTELMEDAIPTIEKIWSEYGTGWFVDICDSGQYEGFKTVALYYGSSVYNSAQMSMLIDDLVSEAKNQGVEVISDSELALLKDGWGK